MASLFSDLLKQVSNVVTAPVAAATQQQQQHPLDQKIQLDLEPLLPKLKQIQAQLFNYNNEFTLEQQSLVREFEVRKITLKSPLKTKTTLIIYYYYYFLYFI